MTVIVCVLGVTILVCGTVCYAWSKAERMARDHVRVEIALFSIRLFTGRK
jgi:hypothetical protein